MLLLLREGYSHLACDQRGREEIPQTSLNPSHSNLQKLQVVCLIPPVNVLLAQPVAGNCSVLSSQYHLYHGSPQLLHSCCTLLSLFHHTLLFSLQATNSSSSLSLYSLGRSSSAYEQSEVCEFQRVCRYSRAPWISRSGYI